MFILSNDGRDENVDACFEAYSAYLAEKAAVFPPSALALAKSEWYFDFRDPRSPHDAWLEAATLEQSLRDDRSSALSLAVRLRSAYGNGTILLRYLDVATFSLSEVGHPGHPADWRYDELRLSDSGRLVHEIEWWSSRERGRWIVEASDLTLTWLPGSA